MKAKTKKIKRKEKKKTVPVSELKIDKSQESNGSSSQNSWWSTLSGLSTIFYRSQKRELSDDEEDEKWWSSFCSQETKNESLFSSQANKEDS